MNNDILTEPELSIFGDFPIERPEAVGLTEFTDCLRIRDDRAGRRYRSF